MNSSLHQLPGDTDDRASQNRGIYIFVVLPVLATVTSLFVAARFYNRIGIHHEFRFDDYLIAFSLVSKVILPEDERAELSSIRGAMCSGFMGLVQEES